MKSSTPMKKLLFTVNLQKDFLYKKNPLPYYNIGEGESRRILGEKFQHGPLVNFLRWVEKVPESEIEVVHIKTVDKHNRDEDTSLILQLENLSKTKPNHTIVQISGVNPMSNTPIEKIIGFGKKKRGEVKISKIGVIGLNCESTMTFLMYELSTKLGFKNIATCVELTGTKSRLQHSNSLNQMKLLFGVQGFDSSLKFQNWFHFSNDRHSVLVLTKMEKQRSKGEFHRECKEQTLTKIEREIVDFLYRDSSEYHLKILKGGNSDAKVYEVRSKDWYDQEQAVTVLKIGTLRKTSREKKNYERIATVLGPSAPSILDYVELSRECKERDENGNKIMEEKAGIKFMFASMDTEEENVTFRDVYLNEEMKYTQSDITRILDITFKKLLGKLYKSVSFERGNLFKMYDFNGTGWNFKAGGTDTVELVKKRVTELLGVDENTEILDFNGVFSSPNVGLFLENDLKKCVDQLEHALPKITLCFVHGDLNGRNILLDPNRNVWVIDFEYTRKDHILKDTTKLEMDIFFEFTCLRNEEDLREAFLVAKQLLEVNDLRMELPKKIEGVNSIKMKKAWRNILFLRKITRDIIKGNTSSLQLDIVMLRYSLWAMTWTHIPKYNRVWALSLACGYANKIKNRILKKTIERKL